MYDKNGTEIRPGDVVIVPCVVDQVFETGPNHPNVQLKTLIPMFPGEAGYPLTLSNLQLEKVNIGAQWGATGQQQQTVRQGEAQHFETPETASAASR